MESGVLALDPVLTEEVGSEDGFLIIQRLQRAGLLKRLRPVAVIHAGTYVVPKSYFEEHKDRFSRAASSILSAFCKRFSKSLTPRVITSKTSLTVGLIHKLCSFTKQELADVLIVRSSDRQAAQYWLLGSFAETVALTGDVPTMIVKPHSDTLTFSKRPSIIVPLDITRSLPEGVFDWITATAKSSNAAVKLVYVKQSMVDQHADTPKLQRPFHSIRAVAEQLRARGWMQQPLP